MALIVGLVAWLATKDGEDSSSSSIPQAGIDAQIVSVEELEELAASAGHPVYWAGEIPGKELEASESTEGNFQLRYLPEMARADYGLTRYEASCLLSFQFNKSAIRRLVFGAQDGRREAA